MGIYIKYVFPRGVRVGICYLGVGIKKLRIKLMMRRKLNYIIYHTHIKKYIMKCLYEVLSPLTYLAPHYVREYYFVFFFDHTTIKNQVSF